MTSILMKRGHLDKDTHTGRTPHEDERSDQVTHIQAKERHRLPADHQKLGGGRDQIPLTPEGLNCANTFNSECQLP